MLRIELSSTELTTMIAHRRWLQLLLSSTDIPLNLTVPLLGLFHKFRNQICSNLFKCSTEHQSPALKMAMANPVLLYVERIFFQRGVRVLCIALQAPPIHNAAHPCSTNGLQRGRYQVLMPSKRILGNACRDSAGPSMLTTIYI